MYAIVYKLLADTLASPILTDLAFFWQLAHFGTQSRRRCASEVIADPGTPTNSRRAVLFSALKQDSRHLRPKAPRVLN